MRILVAVFTALLLVSTLHSGLASAAKCRALALEGGGSRGAYYCGVLRGLVEQTGSANAADLAWDVVTGISAGAIVGFGVALFPVGSEDAMSFFLSQTALNVNQTDVYSIWPPGGIPGLLEGATLRSGLFDTKPLRETIQKLSDLKGGLKNRKLVVGASSLTDGHFHTWNETVGTAKMIDAVMASSAIPGLFPAQHVDGEVFSDGGVIENLNVDSAVLRCRDMGFAMSDIIVDIILSSGREIEPVDASKFTTIKVMERNWAISRYDSSMRLVNNARQAYPNVTFRYVVYPSQSMPGAFNFSTAAMTEFVQVGLVDGKNAVLNAQKN
mmetsp:Transcript_37827/g.95071  ORF Transcript_37827/g.95071 Transcript_37827/m.95071 type:complete len:326 (+) Transcript_37827:274-1251(+)